MWQLDESILEAACLSSAGHLVRKEMGHNMSQPLGDKSCVPSVDLKMDQNGGIPVIHNLWIHQNDLSLIRKMMF